MRIIPNKLYKIYDTLKCEYVSPNRTRNTVWMYLKWAEKHRKLLNDDKRYIIHQFSCQWTMTELPNDE